MKELLHLADQIESELRRFESDIAMGKAEDYGAYKYACGIYVGLLKAKGMLLEIVEKKHGDEDA